MFVLEWLKDGRTIQSEPVLAANLDDVLRDIRADAVRISSTLGATPDTVRIKDFQRGKITIHELKASDD